MPNGRPGDDPINDVLVHGLRPFGGGVEQEIEKLAQEFGDEGVRRLRKVRATPAFHDACWRINEQQHVIRDLVADVWNELILDRRRRNQE